MTSLPSSFSPQSVDFDVMSDAYTLTNARSRLGELVNRARFGRERIILTEHGAPVAAIISVEELAELQAAVDDADIAAAAAVDLAVGRDQRPVPSSSGRPGSSQTDPGSGECPGR
jgi:prevent-host-death family protein